MFQTEKENYDEVIDSVTRGLISREKKRLADMMKSRITKAVINGLKRKLEDLMYKDNVVREVQRRTGSRVDLFTFESDLAEGFRNALRDDNVYYTSKEEMESDREEIKTFLQELLSDNDSHGSFLNLNAFYPQQVDHH